MQYDEIINCPKSGGDLCYKVEINKEITNYLSLSCGFWTNSLMKENSEFYNEQISTLPELYKDLAWTDPETDLIWIPNTINIEDNSNNNVPLLNILRHGLEEYMKSYDNLPSMLIFINTHHSDLPSKEDFDNSWIKLTCSSNSMYMPVESIREVLLSKKSAELEILNPGRFKDIYPAHEKLCKWKENFLCCTPDSILHDYLFSSVASD